MGLTTFFFLFFWNDWDDRKTDISQRFTVTYDSAASDKDNGNNFQLVILSSVEELPTPC